MMYGLVGLVVANLLIGMACRLAAPRASGQWLCLAAIAITALSVLWIVKVIADNAGLRESTAGIFAFPGLLLILELVWLIWVYWASYRRREPPGPNPH